MDRIVNQLVPHYLGGRKLILFLQSCLQPLNSLNKEWKDWADEKRTEAAMTSQVILLEFYLNKKFSKYFKDKTDRIVLIEGSVKGVPVFYEGAKPEKSHLVLYQSEEPQSKNVAFLYEGEKLVNGDMSFSVSCPDIDETKISKEELTSMITYHVKRYCIAGKKFNVIYESK